MIKYKDKIENINELYNLIEKDELEEFEISNIDESDLVASNIDISKCKFENCICVKSNFEKTSFTDVILVMHLLQECHL